MDRRRMLRLLAGAGMVATAAKFGLLEMEQSVNRVYSFPSQIRIASFMEVTTYAYSGPYDQLPEGWENAKVFQTIVYQRGVAYESNSDY